MESLEILSSSPFHSHRVFKLGEGGNVSRNVGEQNPGLWEIHFRSMEVTDDADTPDLYSLLLLSR